MIAHALQMMRHARHVQRQFVDPTRETPIRWRAPNGAEIVVEPVDDPHAHLIATLDRIDWTPRHHA